LVQGAESGGDVLGEQRAVVVLTASALGKVLKSRSRSRVWMILLGSARTGMG
jgi:hypothetical protein